MNFTKSGTIKLYLYAQVYDPKEDMSFDVFPSAGVEKQEDIHIYQISHDPRTISNISLKIYKKPTPESFVHVQKIVSEDIEYCDFKRCTVYKLWDNTVIKNTHGYLSWAGEFNIKLRYNLMIHRYMNFCIDS